MPSIGILVGLPIVVIILAACTIVAWGTKLNTGPMDPYHTSDARIIWWCCWGVAVITLIITAFAFWPYQWDYHHWSNVNGKVQNISSRLIAADHGTNQRFVFVINNQPYAVDDTRAALVHTGDTVHLSCKREYQWAAQSGWACRWNGRSS